MNILTYIEGNLKFNFSSGLVDRLLKNISGIIFFVPFTARKCPINRIGIFII
jgi:hypothetical protein